MQEIRIQDKIIGKGRPTFIIAEAGINHNGSLYQAKKLVDIAYKACVDAVKFQTYKAEKLVTSKLEPPNYAVQNIGKKISQYKMLKSYELNYNDFIKLKQYCDKKGIIFLSTPHSYDAIDFLDELVPAYKFGSGDLTNIPALIHAAKKGKPIILGTGMSNLSEIKKAIKQIRSQGNNQIIALHCTTSYPCKYKEVNLRAMVTMNNELDCIIGFSDHSVGTLASVIAVSLGALVIEKHFTLDKSLQGPDHKASLDANELNLIVKQIRNVEKILGSNQKKPTKQEKRIMKNVRKSITTVQEIKRGSFLNDEMILIRRPGTGLSPDYFYEVIGKKAKIDMKKDHILQIDDIE